MVVRARQCGFDPIFQGHIFAQWGSAMGKLAAPLWGFFPIVTKGATHEELLVFWCVIKGRLEALLSFRGSQNRTVALDLGQTLADGILDQLGARVQVEPGHDVLPVAGHGLGADA